MSSCPLASLHPSSQRLRCLGSSHHTWSLRTTEGREGTPHPRPSRRPASRTPAPEGIPPLSHHMFPPQLQAGLRPPLAQALIPAKGDSMTLFSENPPQASVICDLMRSLLIITSVVLIARGILMRLPEEAAAGAEAGAEFSASGPRRVLGTVTATEHDPSGRALHLHFN